MFEPSPSASSFGADKFPAVSGLSHPLETILHTRTMRALLGIATHARPGKRSFLERLFRNYDNPELPKLAQWRWRVPSLAIDFALRRAKLSKTKMKQSLFHHVPTVKSLVVTARSIARYGLSTPQRFDAPLFIVWNITQACNLNCRHCYQNATAHPLSSELTREEKLKVIDEMGDASAPFLAIAGGEPLASRDLWTVLERCKEREVHVSLATNGTLLTRPTVNRLIQSGVKYLEVSVDSLDPQEHDFFRGKSGAWERAIQGIRNSVDAGMRTGLAMCFTNRNVDRAEEAIDFAIGLGCRTFSHFNFIPVGRGAGIAREDLSPEQRETLMKILTRRLQGGEINIISTAPQFGRACTQYGLGGKIFPAGHAGSGGGWQTIVLSRYIGGCGAARCYCALQPDGTVTPCVYIPSIKLGNVRRRRLVDIWDSEIGPSMVRRQDFGGRCGACDYNVFCGGCRARALAYNNDLLSADPGCIRNSAQWDEITSGAELLPIMRTGSGSR